MNLKAFKFRLYPSKPQAETLRNHLRLHRELYNAALEERREAYRKVGKSVSVYEQMRSLPEVKAGRPEFKDLNAQTLQGTLKKLDKAFQAFFKRCKTGKTPGFPRFQGRNRFDSFAYPQLTRDGDWVGAGKPVSDGTKVYLPKIGNVRMKMHRPLEGTPKTLTIKREGLHWYAVYTCEVESKPLPATGSSIGIDLGTNPNFLMTSDGEFVAAPKHFRSSEAKLRRAQRIVSKRKRRSKRQGKARDRVAKIHRKIANQRRDFHHKTARKLVNEHDFIAHEKLNVIGLARTRLAKSVLDSGWTSFLNILASKAENAARRCVPVNPAFTSQDCSVCGFREKHPLSVREFTCKGCGTSHHRDVNAARVILARAARQRPKPEGAGVGSREVPFCEQEAIGSDGAFGYGVPNVAAD